MTQEEGFEAWFNELERNLPRAERFYESMTQFNSTEALARSFLLVQWLQAAYKQGFEDAKSTL